MCEREHESICDTHPIQLKSARVRIENTSVIEKVESRSTVILKDYYITKGVIASRMDSKGNERV